jgi:hypothetical protein
LSYSHCLWELDRAADSIFWLVKSAITQILIGGGILIGDRPEAIGVTHSTTQKKREWLMFRVGCLFQRSIKKLKDNFDI